jgi:hypothetical protein
MYLLVFCEDLDRLLLFKISLYCMGVLLVARLVETLHYKPEGRGFDSRRCRGIFHLYNPSSCITALGLTLLLTETSARNISWA